MYTMWMMLWVTLRKSIYTLNPIRAVSEGIVNTNSTSEYLYVFSVKEQIKPLHIPEYIYSFLSLVLLKYIRLLFLCIRYYPHDLSRFCEEFRQLDNTICKSQWTESLALPREGHRCSIFSRVCRRGDTDIFPFFLNLTRIVSQGVFSPP